VLIILIGLVAASLYLAIAVVGEVGG